MARTFVHSALGLFAAASSVIVTVAPAVAADQPTTPAHQVGGYVAGPTRVSATRQVSSFAVLPASVNLSANLPPVGDQGQIGSCVAWTIAHSIMGYYANKDGASGAPYAPLYLYLRVVAKGGAPSAGLNPQQALTEATGNGVDTQDDYVQGTTNWQSAPTSNEIANAAHYKVNSWTTLWSGANQGTPAQTAMETALAAGSPVAIGMPVYQNFMNLGANTLYKNTSGSMLGGHMVTAYAYDSEGIWIRNQWGTGWGTAGDAHLAWSFVNTSIMGAYTISGVHTPTTNAAVQPVVTGLSVNAGSVVGGTSVTITGAGLAGATAVKFGTVTAPFQAVESNGVTRLVATAPAHEKGIFDVTVTNAAGTSAIGSATKFTYSAPAPSVPAPTITGLSVTSGPATAATPVIINGTNFVDVKQVTSGGVNIDSQRLSDTQIKVTLPVHAAGKVVLKVVTATGSVEGTAFPFTYLAPTTPTVTAPTVTALNPSVGSVKMWTMIELTGTNVGSATAVTLAGLPVSFMKVSDGKLLVLVPPHAAGALPLQVTTANGTSSPNVTFTYRA